MRAGLGPARPLNMRARSRASKIGLRAGPDRPVDSLTGTRPCIWQIQVVRKVLEGGDVITIAATGSGKTFTYWMLLLYIKHGIVLLVTLLKLLGKQFVDMLTKNHLKAVSLTAANATNTLFKVC